MSQGSCLTIMAILKDEGSVQGGRRLCGGASMTNLCDTAGMIVARLDSKGWSMAPYFTVRDAVLRRYSTALSMAVTQSLTTRSELAPLGCLLSTPYEYG